jgi:hypothetical protein
MDLVCLLDTFKHLPCSFLTLFQVTASVILLSLIDKAWPEVLSSCNYIILSSLVPSAALGLAVYSPLKEMSIRSRKVMFMGGMRRPARKTDKFTTICEPIV